MAQRPPASIVIEGLSHRYRGAPRLALSAVNLSILPGQRIGLLGPNGAGKSTLMRLLCGYLPVQRESTGLDGRVEIAGHSVSADTQRTRDQVGYLPEHVPLYHELRVTEHLRFRAKIKRLPRRQIAAEIERVAAATGVLDRLHTPIGQLSRGYRQRVGLADALIGSPPLLVLDEPTVGLDPNQIVEIRAMLHDLGGHQTLILSSHMLSEVEALCDRVVILSEGCIVADQSLDDVVRASYIVGRFAAPLSQIKALMKAVALQVPFDVITQRMAEIDDLTEVTLRIGRGHASDVERLCRAVAQRCVQASVPVVGLAPGRTPLHERFSEVTGAQAGAAN